jgi:hypothetical protein
MATNKPSFFARYIDNPPPAQAAQEPSAAQRTLEFLQRWPKETISLRELQQFGPRATARTQQGVLDSTKVLERHGWLRPVPSHRRDRRHWQVIRRLTINPTVAT